MGEAGTPLNMPARASDPGGEGTGKKLSAEEFATALQNHGRLLWTLAAGVLGDPSEAEDIVQEAALMALNKRDGFDPQTSFAAWMGRFVRFVALNHARKRARRATHAVDPEGMAELVQSAPSSLEASPVDPRGELFATQTAFDDRVLGGLQELGAVPRAALLLRSVLGLTYREISQALDMPEGTAMSHVHRARTKLRTILTPSADAPVALEGQA